MLDDAQVMEILAQDESEVNDVANDHQEIVKGMQIIMDSSRVDTPFWPIYQKRKQN